MSTYLGRSIRRYIFWSAVNGSRRPRRRSHGGLIWFLLALGVFWLCTTALWAVAVAVAVVFGIAGLYGAYGGKR